MQQTFLIEIGTEELPPKNLRLLAESFTLNFKYELKQAKINYSNIFWYASPRRLALKVINLSLYQNDYEVKIRGPIMHKAFDLKGKPTKEAKNWAKHYSINIEQAEYLKTDKGKWLFYKKINKGISTKTLLVNIVKNSLDKLTILKLMKWGDNKIKFIRPVRTLVMLLGNELIEGKILGIYSNRIIRGHRFMGKTELIIHSADQYPMILYKYGKVIADYEERKLLIKNKANELACKLGGIIELPNNLLEEVTSLVEWPVILTAKFDKKFLLIPIEALVNTMKQNQKYFPIYDKVGNLMTNFIFVTNIESPQPQQIISGNERVIYPRLEDTLFFFKMDRKKRLEEYLPKLKTILFQKQLGTLYDKTNRLKILTSWIANKIGSNIKYATRAALLCKCDLITNMVCENTNIQGIIGMYYARLDGENEDVAIAIKEHYQPCFSGDNLPSNYTANALALADKIDTLVGIFGINKKPNSNKDPFALRRITIGILRIIIEKNFILDLLILVKKTTKLYGNKLINKNVINDVIEFIMGRFNIWLQEQGYNFDIIQSVLSRKITTPIDSFKRIKAITYFKTLPVSKILIITNKRIANILKKSNEKLNKNIKIKILKNPEEIILAKYLIFLEKKILILLSENKYQDALIELTSLNKIIDDFFKKITIMDSNKEIRINRLTLLNKLYNLFLKIADISLLQ